MIHKGGTAKTTTTATLGGLFAKKGFRVLLVDADDQSNLKTIFGINGQILAYS